MRKLPYRFLMDQSFTRTESFAELCRGGNKKVLIRRRKMPLEDLI